VCCGSCCTNPYIKKIPKKEKKQILVKFNTRKNNYLKHISSVQKNKLLEKSPWVLKDFVFGGRATAAETTYIHFTHTHKQACVGTYYSSILSQKL
jgi:hypothetical protein